jgi:two-component system, chemotaxis family, protein-glutamate methylesterase/glutaminase
VAHAHAGTSAEANGGIRRDIIVVGTSAGGVEALSRLVEAMPDTLDAAMFIVLHTSATGPGRLPTILQRRASLPVSHGVDRERVKPGHIYVAPPDHHLILEAGHMRVTRGPKENHTRPAVDPLFRSAALTYGQRVIGVVLTGGLDDGSAGLAAVKQRGGVAIVQDPEDAMFPDMPRNAMRRTPIDHVVRLEALPSLLVRLVAERAQPMTDLPKSKDLEIEVRIAAEENPLKAGVMELGPVSPYTCPDCHGVLLQIAGSGMPRFRCHTGHAFSLDGLAATVTSSVEDTLWSGFRAIEESIMLLRHMAKHARDGGDEEAASALEARARTAQARGEAVRHAAMSPDLTHPLGGPGAIEPKESARH